MPKRIVGALPFDLQDLAERALDVIPTLLADDQEPPTAREMALCLAAAIAAAVLLSEEAE